jgi:hypothetical protein
MNEIIERGDCIFGNGLRDIIGITVKRGNRKVSMSIDYHYREGRWFLSSLCIKEGNEILLSCLMAPAIWLPGGKRGQPDDPINGFIDLYEKIARAIFDGADIILLAKYSTGQVQYKIIEQIIQNAIEGG